MSSNNRMEHATIIAGDHGSSQASGVSSGFPTDLLARSVTRLRRIAVIYAIVFFLAGVLPALLIPVDRAMFFSSPIMWLPALLGILIATVVAATMKSPPFRLTTVVNAGLVFEVVSSYAIAAAE